MNKNKATQVVSRPISVSVMCFYPFFETRKNWRWIKDLILRLVTIDEECTSTATNLAAIWRQCLMTLLTSSLGDEVGDLSNVV